MTVEERIQIAEERIVKAEERRTYFLQKAKETGKALYAEMAMTETELIEKIQEAIGEVLLRK